MHGSLIAIVLQDEFRRYDASSGLAYRHHDKLQVYNSYILYLGACYSYSSGYASWHKIWLPYITKMFRKILVSVEKSFMIQIRICLTKSFNNYIFFVNLDFILCPFCRSLKCMNNKDKKKFLRTIRSCKQCLSPQIHNKIYY